jgi:predicted ATPase/DNA-binding CsgD family transcriptional regulator
MAIGLNPRSPQAPQTPQAPRSPGALPAEVSSFVGRRSELAQLASQLRMTRLVTVTGPGGVGKTRVTLRTAAECAGQFADGLCLAELAGLRDPELLPLTVASCLGLPDQETRSQLDAILDYLRRRQLMLILDGCEHLVDAAAMLVTMLLRETAGVTVIATSRQPLDVDGEHLCQIQPLPVPEPGSHDAGHGDAVELFAQRAAAVVPGFAITEDNRDDVIRLCQRLDGIPLAIELATVRLRAVPLKQLAGRIDDRFRLLTAERRAALPHHRTLRTATEWSYELCSPAEQLMWTRLSVFAGPFDASAAEQVCAGEPLAPRDILPTLIGLVDKSVVLRVAGDGPDEARYRQLDTIREFGAEKLAEAGGEAAVRDRHISRYLAMARYLGAHPASEDQIPRYRELLREHADVRAALNYAFARPGHDSEAAHLATDLYGYWQTSGLSEGRYWMAKVLDRFPSPSPERAWALVQTGIVASLQGEIRDALAALAEGIPMAEQIGEITAAGRGYSHRTLALAIAGQHTEAEAAGARAGELLETADDTGGLIGLDIFTGYLHLVAGEPDRAIERCAQGLGRLPARSRERWMQGWLHSIAGLGSFLLGALEPSADSLSKALEMKRELDDSIGTAWCLEVLAWVAAAQQRPRRAAWLLGAADPLWERAGIRLSGTPQLEELHLQVDKTVSALLGAEQYTVLHRRGARGPLQAVVKAAVGGEDDLRTPRAGDRHAIQSALTARQHEVAALVAEGLSNKDIAERLVISKRTVDSHIEHILAKLGVSSRIQIAAWVRPGPLQAPGAE